jgi:MoxR-like ATPase
VSDSTRSCLNCPSYLAKEQVAKVFGKNIGAPMCARFGKVLGAPDILPVAEAKLQQRVAEGCHKFGEPAPKAPAGHLQTDVTLPDVMAAQALLAEPSSDDDKLMVNTCIDCRFYVPESDVMDAFGWAAGLCSAQGRLIVPGMGSKEAAKCEQRKPGSFKYYENAHKATPPGDLHLIPMYGEAKAYDPSPLGRWKLAKEQGTMVDPTVYPTDAPVSDEDKEFGIRAWRRVEDPNGTGNFTHLPIFDPDSFPEAERQFIPATGSKEHPEDYIDAKDYVYSVAVEWMELDATPALWGPPGVGKTELARHLAWLMQIPFDRVSFTKSMEVDDLIGKMMYTPGEGTFFQWGRLPHAWKKRRIILLDEPNAGPDEVWQRVRPLTDNSKQLVLDEAGAEVVERHPFGFLIMAMNPAWDTRNTGVSELADADVDRLSHLYMDLPPREVEYEILKSACEKDGWTPDKKMLNGVLDNADEIRALVDDGSLPTSWGVRPNLKVIRHLKWFDALTAYKRAVVDVLDKDAGEMVLDIVRTGGRV